MKSRIRRYVDERTGLGPVVRYVLDRRIPRGISWLQTFGSASLTLFLLMVVTGMFLALNYAPSISDAHASTAYIQRQVPLGSFVLGLHYWGASAMVVLVTIHLLRVFFMGAYKFPRELNWMIGVIIFGISILTAFTGYLSQQNFDGQFIALNAKDAMNGAGIGSFFNVLNFGQMYGLHVMLLPIGVTFLVVVHIVLVRMRGVVKPIDAEGGARR